MAKLKINSDNILPIIKQWLYSDKDIFLRELVSNACDAIQKLKHLRDQGDADVADSEFRIDVAIDKENQKITISDTGIGMTKDEVEKYIAQIAVSGAEDFIKKYETNEEKDQIIGHFGLGFYSSFMISDTVEIDTLSYQEGSEAAHWSCDGSSDYTLGQGERTTRGTTITLNVSDNEKEYLEADKIRSLLVQYSSYLPYPIHLNDEQINTTEPLWMRPASECTDQDYLDFYKHLYPMDEEPLFWIHLNVDYPFHLKGILYFPHVPKNFDINKSTIQLFCNRVFVADNCKDLLPDYLMVLRGAIDSPDIPLNVSRSYLQVDRTVRQVSAHISKKVADRITSAYTTDQEKYLKAWSDIEVILKLGILQDDKFYERTKSALIWKNLEGEWTTLEEYQERNGEKYDNKVFYTMGESQESKFIEMYRNQGVEVLQGNPMIDNHMIAFLEGKAAPAKFQRIDGAIDDAILDSSREKSLLDADGKTEATHIADLVREKLSDESVDVEAKSLASDDVPGFIMIDEQSRRLREMMQQHQGISTTMPDLVKYTFIANTNSPLIGNIRSLDKKDPALAEAVVKEVYQLAKLSQRELQPSELDTFVADTTAVLEKLTKNLID